MLTSRQATGTRDDIARLCASGLDSVTLRSEIMRRMRRVVPVESFWFATADPATLLFTGSVVEGIPEKATPLFVANEFRQTDVNKWVALAAAKPPVNSLYLATKGHLEQSPRYRDICVPLGFGDELRAALMSGGSCWGFMCLHRDFSGLNFSTDEAEFLNSLAPHLAQGLRAALLLDQAKDAAAFDGPGFLMLAEDFSVAAATPAGDYWLSEIADWPARRELPQVIHAAAARLALLEAGTPGALPARARVRAKAGQWLIVHASRVTGQGAGKQTAIIFEPAHCGEVAPLLLEAYGLTRREAEVAQLVLRGLSTVGISASLSISDFTVQQHLKSVFDKVGVGSRRELVAQVFAEHYRRRAKPKPASRAH